MEKHKGSSKLMLIFTGLLLSMNTGETYADETNPCAISCASDLKQCPGNPNSGWTTIYKDPNKIENTTLMNGWGAPFDDPFNSPKVEIEKRNNERYQRCETENNNCLRQCMPDQGTESRTPKNSVIIK